jgi:hypothetical protein
LAERVNCREKRAYLDSCKQADRNPGRDVRQVPGNELGVQVRVDEKYVLLREFKDFANLIKIVEHHLVRDRHANGASGLHAKVILGLMKQCQQLA